MKAKKRNIKMWRRKRGFNGMFDEIPKKNKKVYFYNQDLKDTL